MLLIKLMRAMELIKYNCNHLQDSNFKYDL